MKRLLLILAGVSLAIGCTSRWDPKHPMSQRQYTPKSLGYSLFWEDQFNGTELDTGKWEVRGVGPRSIGYVSAQAVKVEDGFLKLCALKKGDSILVGAVGTEGHFMTKYGYFECRGQLQKSPGVWAAFWIQSDKISKGADPATFGAEIDIMEFFKKLGTDIVSHNVHWAYGPNQQSTGGMKSYRKGVGKGFHTFGLEWLPDKYIFYIDGYRYYEVTRGISHIREYLILSMELPSDTNEMIHTIYPDQFVVDYVKVYTKNN